MRKLLLILLLLFPVHGAWAEIIQLKCWTDRMKKRNSDSVHILDTKLKIVRNQFDTIYSDDLKVYENSFYFSAIKEFINSLNIDEKERGAKYKTISIKYYIKRTSGKGTRVGLILLEGIEKRIEATYTCEKIEKRKF